MSDHHEAELDPNVPITHYEIVKDFSGLTVTIATVLGVVATAAGLILGIVLAND